MIRLPTALVLLLAWPLFASAHAIGVEAKLQGDRLRIEAYFDDDSPAADAKVALTAADGRTVAEGRTDKDGIWTTTAPEPGKYHVAVDAGGGHQAKTAVTIPPRDGAAPSTALTAEEPVVSDGPSRTVFTGPMKWAMAAVGLGVIAAVSLVARRLLGKKPAPPSETGA